MTFQIPVLLDLGMGLKTVSYLRSGPASSPGSEARLRGAREGGGPVA